MRFVDADQLNSCVHCGLCLASCPTYVTLGTEADSPRGRIQLIGALERGEIEPTANVRAHLDGCLGCRACETACPSGVPYGALIEAARPFLEANRPLPVRAWRRLLARVLTRPQPLRGVMALLGPLRGSAVLLAAAQRWSSRSLAYVAALPSARPRGPWPRVFEPLGVPRGSAVLVAGCVADHFFASTNRAIAQLLALAGVRVTVAANGACCGALSLHLGDVEGARRQARAVVELPEVATADWIVTTAAGCGALLRECGHLLPAIPAAHALASRARDPLALLAEVGLPPPPNPLPKRVAIHDPCHLAHGQGVREPVRDLLAAIPGLRLVELAEADWCCGSAGTYNLTAPALAARLVARKVDHVVASGAEVIAAANPGCLLQIRAEAIRRGVPVAIEHPIDLLAAAHDVRGG